MREILFRAKREDNGEWVYGYYVRIPDAVGSVHRMYVPAENPDESNAVYFIDPETLGQYTEFKDKKGNFIFEGDIIDFDYDTSVVNWLDCCWALDDGVTLLEEAENVKILGNIYDNPELIPEPLKDGDDNDKP